MIATVATCLPESAIPELIDSDYGYMFRLHLAISKHMDKDSGYMFRFVLANP